MSRRGSVGPPGPTRARPLLPEDFGEALLAVSIGLVVGKLVGTPTATNPGLWTITVFGTLAVSLRCTQRVHFATPSQTPRPARRYWKDARA